MHVVSGRCFRSAIYCAISKLYGLNCPSRRKIAEKFADFRPSKCGDTDRAPSDLRYIITPHSDILAIVPRGGVLRPRRLEREKIIINKQITGVKDNGLPITTQSGRNKSTRCAVRRCRSPGGSMGELGIQMTFECRYIMACQNVSR